MLGPARSAMGGMASVAAVYESAGLFDEWPITYVDTFRDDGTNKIATMLRAFLTAFWSLAKGRARCLHLHVATKTSFYRKSIFMLLAIGFRVPYIFHIHGADFDQFVERQCNPLQRRYVLFTLRKAAAVIALSPFWRDWIMKHVPTATVACIPNPVEANIDDSVPTQTSRRPIVLFLGRLEQRKGIFDLVSAIAAVAEKVPGVILKCGGDGDPTPVLAHARSIGIDDKVQLLGWVRGARKSALLEEAAVLALPSYNEGLPVAILEAMAAQLPVVSTPVGGIPDAIESGHSGLLVPPGNVAALTECLVQLLASPDERQRLATNARSVVAIKYSAEKVLAQVGDLYRSLGLDSIEIRRRNQ